MERLAEDLYLLRGFPPYAINQYLAGAVLIDAGSRHAPGRILRQLKKITRRRPLPSRMRFMSSLSG